MTKRIIAIVLALAMCLCTTACGAKTETAEAKDTLTQIMERGKIIVGIEAQHPPISHTNSETGEIYGLSVDLINLYSEKLGVTVEFKQVEWSALVPGLTSGDTDIISDSLTRTVARSAALNLSDPFFLTGTTAIVRADDDRFTEWEDLNAEGIKIGFTEGTVYADIVAATFPKAEAVTFQSKAEWCEALKAGRVDAIVEEQCTLVDRMSVYPGEFKLYPQSYLNFETFGFACRYGETTLQYSLNLFLQEIKINGEYAALYEKWTGTPWVPGVADI